MFGVDDLAREEVVMDTTTGEHEEQIIEDVNITEPVTTAGEVVTTTTVKDSAAPTTDVTEDKITMAQALAALKSIKPKVVVQKQEMSTTISATATTVTTAVLTPRAKGIVFHEQKQSQIRTVSSLKDKGKAKIIEPEVPIKKKDQMRINKEYARNLEAGEQEAPRLSRAQQDKEGRSFDEIKKLFDRQMRKVNDFIAIDSEAQESSTKRIVEHLKSDISKKQKVDENVEPVIDDSEELKKCMEIVLDDGDEEGKKTYFKIIRADGNSQVYQTFEKMYKNFNREDLVVPWAIVKDRFKKGKPMDAMDNLLFRTLKTMFEHHVEDNIWKYQQGLAKIKNWKLFESEYSQWVERFMNYLEEQTDGEAIINSIKNGDQPLPRVTQVSIAGTTSTEQPHLKDKSMCNKTAKDLCDALARYMLGSEYGEQDKKVAVLYEYETFKATEGE
nr:hypothetical protein [Tanacetum cinerariifolium]